jgi:hypothetical protein
MPLIQKQTGYSIGSSANGSSRRSIPSRVRICRELRPHGQPDVSVVRDDDGQYKVIVDDSAPRRPHQPLLSRAADER